MASLISLILSVFKSGLQGHFLNINGKVVRLVTRNLNGPGFNLCCFQMILKCSIEKLRTCRFKILWRQHTQLEN